MQTVSTYPTASLQQVTNGNMCSAIFVKLGEPGKAGPDGGLREASPGLESRWWARGWAVGPRLLRCWWAAGRAGHPVLLRGDAGSLPRWAPGLILEVAWAIFFLFFQSILFTIIHITIFVNVPMATALTAYIEM